MELMTRCYRLCNLCISRVRVWFVSPTVTNLFPARVGLLQGCSLPPILFITLWTRFLGGSCTLAQQIVLQPHSKKVPAWPVDLSVWSLNVLPIHVVLWLPPVKNMLTRSFGHPRFPVGVSVSLIFLCTLSYLNTSFSIIHLNIISSLLLNNSQTCQDGVSRAA